MRLEIDPEWQLPALTTEDRVAAETHVRALAAAMEPGDPMLVAGRVHVLLAHWRDREQDEQTQIAVANDWVTVMIRYPLWAVWEAAEKWLNYSNRRPQIADIRALCDLAVRQDQLTLRLLRRLVGYSANRSPDV